MNNIVLVIAPHPDDEILGCAGTMMHHSAEGDEVHILIVSTGDPEIYPPEEEEAIRKEAVAAHQVLGVTNTHFLNFPAPRLDTIPGYKLAEAISGVVRLIQPHTVYLPHHGDLHVDHRAVYLATLVATRPINQCSVRKLMCYETLSETGWSAPTGHEAFIPNFFVDITPYLESKVQAMQCYQLEIKRSPHPRSLTALEALAKFRGSTVSLPAAEAFALVREIQLDSR